MYEKYFKRLLDIIFSLVALIILLPVFLVISIIVKLGIGSPVMFVQRRPGKNEKIFKLYKFRSMSNEKDKNGLLLPDELRLNKLGKLLRASSLDELPELWNILKGDMSFVGPRPLLVAYLDLYDENQKHRHDVRPGLTGLAQVKGRNSISWEEKFQYDLEYIANISFQKDILIVLKTFKTVLLRKGIHSEVAVTMEQFERRKKRLAIIGAGGHGKVIYETAKSLDRYSEIVFFDDKWEELEKAKNGFILMGNTKDIFSEVSNYDVFVAIGNNVIRKKFIEKLEKESANLPVLVHPAAVVSESVKIKKGSVVMPGAVINAGSTIGKGCIINTGSIVEHDNIIEDYTHISPNVTLGGTVKIGQKVHVGIGATVKNNVTVCNGCIIGAGAVVINDILKRGTYVGVPVIQIEKRCT